MPPRKLTDAKVVTTNKSKKVSITDETPPISPTPAPAPKPAPKKSKKNDDEEDEEVEDNSDEEEAEDEEDANDEESNEAIDEIQYDENGVPLEVEEVDDEAAAQQGQDEDVEAEAENEEVDNDTDVETAADAAAAEAEDNDDENSEAANTTGNLDLMNCVIDDEEDEMQIDYTEVPTSERISMPKLTKYEEVRIIAVRTTQLALGAPAFVKNVNNKSPEEIAKIELSLNMIPYKIKRYMPNRTYEIWHINELEKNKYY